jgi:integral membrane protein (TIGR01906 family)
MKILKIIVSITIPFFLIILFASILTTTPYLIVSKGLYESHSRIEFDHDYAAERIMGYLNYRYPDLEFGSDELDDSNLLREEEIVHMEDVLNVYTGLRIAAFSSLIIGVSLSIIIYKKNREELYKTYKHMYMGPALFVLFLGGYILIDFNAAFTAFHNIFFPQGGWTLNSNDALIQLLPTAFWMVSGIIILVLFSLSMGLIYYLNEKIFKKKLIN